ncbi:MAG TPA: hypothetical protein VII06_28345 [Chloroflexota bacterium]|jgi:ABC-type Fe3+ transport system substrate-binding protein
MTRLTVLVLVALLAMACAPTAGSSAAGASAPSRPAVSQAAPQPATGGSAGPEFQQLVERARASDGRLRSSMASYTPEYVRAIEGRFQERFGIPLHLENEPGHASREIPQKILQAQRAGKGVVDWVETGNPSNFAPLMEAGALQVPPWDALSEEWPQIADLRQLYPNAPGGPNGTTLQDYCMLQTQALWTLVYNTRNVRASDVQNLVLDDLLTDKWRGRLAFDADGLGFKELPFHKDWSLERVQAYAHNLGANGLKLISGGSNGVGQAIIQGEGDIGFMSSDIALDLISTGAPLALAWPDVIPTNDLGTCIPAITANNPDLAALFFAWRDLDGQWLRAELGGGGARPFYAPEADRYPLAKLVKETGVTNDRLARPASLDDYRLIDKQRAAAVEAQKAGIQSGTRVPYPWACQRQHPACVQ